MKRCRHNHVGHKASLREEVSQRLHRDQHFHDMPPGPCSVPLLQGDTALKTGLGLLETHLISRTFLVGETGFACRHHGRLQPGRWLQDGVF